MSVVDEKKALRERLTELRAHAAATTPTAAEDLARAYAVSTVPSVVAGTFPMRSELDPRPLMRRLKALGATLALPRTPRRGQPLTFHRWDTGTLLVTSRYGVTEPVEETPIVIPDLVLVPLLAFDRTGARLGYGGGYYDVTLAALRASGPVFALGLAYAVQEIDCVPTEPHDVHLDAVLTERELIITTRSE
ncbi:MAG: 5-formyltetrahydrofolate cyclo-ligase [Myxococcales bacterium]|nr:5-formyltetrahydrofolate cyclo-ligase [Myxococcales bacterium]